MNAGYNWDNETLYLINNIHCMLLSFYQHFNLTFIINIYITFLNTVASKLFLGFVLAIICLYLIYLVL